MAERRLIAEKPTAADVHVIWPELPLPVTHQTGLVGNWPSHWDQSVCWCSFIFISSLCFPVALISRRHGVRATWLNGLFICWERVKGHSSTVGIAWCSQSWRDLWLFIPDLMTCFIIFIWFRELDTLSGWCCCVVTYWNNLIWWRKFNGPSLFNLLASYPYPISTFTLVNSWENKLVWPLSWRV